MGQNAYQTAVETLARRRSHAEAQAARRREELYQNLPERRRFDARAAALCRQMTAAILEGEPSAEYQQALQSLQGERLAALQAAGVDEAQLRPRYTCPHCRDTGFVNGQKCHCFHLVVIIAILKIGTKLHISHRLSFFDFRSQILYFSLIATYTILLATFVFNKSNIRSDIYNIHF